jgi:hypothetical protein
LTATLTGLARRWTRCYEPDGLEIEFVRASGRTQALVTLRERDVRPIADGDLMAVRRLDRSA